MARAVLVAGRLGRDLVAWIAQHGYDPSLGHGNTAAFFPLFPITWAPLTWLPGPLTLWGTLLCH